MSAWSRLVAIVKLKASLCPWFIKDVCLQELKANSFNARKKFQFGIMVVRAAVRISRMRYTPEPLSLEVSRNDPYKIKVLRKVSSISQQKTKGGGL